MKTNFHTIILSTPKIAIPEAENVQFIKDLLQSNLVNLKYFGEEQNLRIDYNNTRESDTMSRTTYLTFHFEQENINNYGLLEEEIFQMILNKLEAAGHIEERIVNEKDIEMYI